MCLIMTIIAAVIFSVVFLMQKKNNVISRSVVTTTLMFWAAAIMWSVDGIASVVEGEGFFDISTEDTILGGLIVAAGLFVFLMLRIVEKRRLTKN